MSKDSSCGMRSLTVDYWFGRGGKRYKEDSSTKRWYISQAVSHGCHGPCHKLCMWLISVRPQPSLWFQLRWQIWCWGRTCYSYSLWNQPQQRHSWYWIPLEVVLVKLIFHHLLVAAIVALVISAEILWNICIQ